MATCIHSSWSCLLPFYTIPIFPLLNRKIFHLLVIYRVVMGTFMLFTHILPTAICCCVETCNVHVMLSTLVCICVHTFMGTCANVN